MLIFQLGKIPSEHPKPGGSKNHGDISSFSNLYRYSPIGTDIAKMIDTKYHNRIFSSVKVFGIILSQPPTL